MPEICLTTQISRDKLYSDYDPVGLRLWLRFFKSLYVTERLHYCLMSQDSAPNRLSTSYLDQPRSLRQKEPRVTLARIPTENGTKQEQ
jgi:hypothetical protein